MSAPLDVAVVGAGPAGLAAAWALSEAGARVSLYERREEPGGRLRTEVLEGARADVAAQFIGSYYGETLRLAREAGAEGLLVRAPGRDALWRGGRIHRLTYGSVASLATSGALPAGLKLRLATRYLSFLRRHLDLLDPNEPARAAEAGLDRESIAAWGRRELGDDFVELLAYPQLGAFYASTPEETSAGFYHTLARAGLEASVYAVRGGMGELARAVLRALQERGASFLGGAEVREVEAGATGVVVRRSDGETRHDAVVLALPAPAAARIAALGGPVREWLGQVRTAPAISLALLTEAPVAADFFGLSFPRAESPGERAVALCVQDQKGAGLGGEGQGVILLYPAPAIAGELAEASPREVLDALLPAAERAFPGLGRRVRRARSFRFPDGATVFYPGYLERLRGFDPGWLPDRVALAGDYLVAPTIEGAVRSGLRAARRLLCR